MAVTVTGRLNGYNGAAGTVVTATGSETITAGNTLFVAVATDTSAGTITVTDNLGNTYTAVDDTSLAGSIKTYLFRAPITTGGTLTTITATQAGVTTGRGITSAEVTDDNSLSVTAEAGGSGTSATGTSATGSGLHWFVLGVIFTPPPANLGVTAPSGYTLARGPNSSSNDRQPYLFYKVGSETGGSVTATLDDSVGWAVLTEYYLTAPTTEGVSFDSLTFRATAT